MVLPASGEGNMDSMNIRRFTSSDSISELTNLIRRAYEPLAQMGLRYNGTWQDDNRTVERIAGHECFIAEADGKFIATICLQKAKPAGPCQWYQREDVASFLQFAVDPLFQGRGLGVELLDFIEQRAVEMGARELAYDTAEPAAHLIHYYRPRGYRFVQYHQWGDTNYRSVVMSKKIGAFAASGEAIKSLPFLVTDRLCICHVSSVTPKQMQDFHLRNAEFFALTSPAKPPNFYTEAWWVDSMSSAYSKLIQGLEVRLVIYRKDCPENVIGSIGLSSIERRAFQACYLGYSLDKMMQGKGIMTEALSEVIRYAFSDLNLHRLMANHLPENDRSAKVLARLGFTREGLAKEYLYLNGKWHDHVLNALVNLNWCGE